MFLFMLKIVFFFFLFSVGEVHFLSSSSVMDNSNFFSQNYFFAKVDEKIKVKSFESKESKENDLIFIEIKKGTSFNEVAEILKKKKLIDSVFYFKLLAWLKGASTKIQSGEYAFSKEMGLRKILNILVKGQTYLHKITFPEGYNLYEIAEELEKKFFLKKEDFISLCYKTELIYELLGEKVNSLEGYLFPETYLIPRPVKAEALIRQMVQNFFTAYRSFGKKNVVVNKKSLSRQKLVTLASIVEKETGLAEERALIAGVFYNRLKKGMRLESDPTILYGMMREAGALVPLNIRKKDILRKTPYNTYRIPGFPVGPISNPGKEALRAVFEPEKSSYFYFVSRNDGSHVFSKTYKEHERAVQLYQKSLIRKKK